jgi:hypothetical protein
MIPRALRIGLIHWLPVVLYCAFIFVQSRGPSPIRLGAFPPQDKAAHFVGYALLGGLLARAIRATWEEMDSGRVWRWATAVAGLYGLLDEIHQAFVPVRSADPLDFAADLLGGMVGSWLVLRWKRRAPARPPDRVPQRPPNAGGRAKPD